MLLPAAEAGAEVSIFVVDKAMLDVGGAGNPHHAARLDQRFELSRWEKFETETSNASDPNLIRSRFPFTEYFSGMPQPLFHGQLTTDISTGRGCMRYIRNIFTELEECRAFELLKDIGSRSNYLLTKQAKVIAMTCTHAAMKRRDFMRLG